MFVVPLTLCPETPAGILNTHGPVVVEVDQVPTGTRGPFHVGVPGCCIHTPRTTVPQVLEKLRKGELCLAEDEVIGFGELIGFCREQRSSGYDTQSCRPASSDEPASGLTLHPHGAHEHGIGPRQIFGGERLDVQVHQPDAPRPGQHRSDGQ